MTAFYIVRWDFIKDNQQKKETRPYSFNVQKNKWLTNNSYPIPHPLYNLRELFARPNAPVLIGEGEVFVDGKLLPTADVFKQYNIKPLSIHIREGLAVLNGTSAMTGIGLLNIIYAKKLLQLSVLLS